MTTADENSTRQWLVWNLLEGHAHQSFEHFVEKVPDDAWGVRPAGEPHSLWDHLEHIRICQWDIWQFSVSTSHVSPLFPDGYWPDSPEPAEMEAVEKSIEVFLSERQQFANIISDSSVPLHEPFSHGDGQNLIREILVLSDHNAYHLGQMQVLLRLITN